LSRRVPTQINKEEEGEKKEPATDQVRSVKLASDELKPDQLKPDQLTPDQLKPDELTPDQQSLDQLASDEQSSEQFPEKSDPQFVDGARALSPQIKVSECQNEKSLPEYVSCSERSPPSTGTMLTKISEYPDWEESDLVLEQLLTRRAEERLRLKKASPSRFSRSPPDILARPESGYNSEPELDISGNLQVSFVSPPPKEKSSFSPGSVSSPKSGASEFDLDSDLSSSASIPDLIPCLESGRSIARSLEQADVEGARTAEQIGSETPSAPIVPPEAQVIFYHCNCFLFFSLLLVSLSIKLSRSV
jgi:hypothetical protein